MLKLCFQASKGYCLFGLLSSGFDYAISTIISIYFMGYIVDSIEQSRPFVHVLLMVIAMFLATIISNLSSVYYYSVMEPVSIIKIHAYFMDMIYKQAISVDLSCFENPEFYDTYTKANDQVKQYATRTIELFRWVIGVIISLIISISVLLRYEPFVILLSIVPVLIEQVLVKKHNKLRYERNKRNTKEERKVEYVNRTIYLKEYAKEIRLSNIFTPIMKGFDNANKQMIENSKVYGKKMAYVRFFRSIITELLVYFCVQSLVIYRYLVHSAYSFSSLTILINAIGDFTNSIGQFTSAWSRLDGAGLFTENFRTFMEYKAKITENEDGLIPNKEELDIVFKNVSFKYEGSKVDVLHNVNLTIRKGERIAIVGHNGAGKSTFVKLLMRLYDVSSGSIHVGNNDIRNYRLSKYKELYGVIFQDFKIFALSVMDNVLLKRNYSKEEEVEGVKALESSGIYNKIMNYKKGVESQLTREFDKEGITMSGGEQQKLAISRVFAKSCDICILDEPSSALDPLSEYEIFENMLEACQGKTVIFISHRLASTALADRIYLFENGEIVEEGSHEELIKLDARYAGMYKVQAEKYKEELAYESKESFI